jgi:hypothetical protein
MDPANGLVLLFLIYAVIFAGAGAAGRLALGWGLGDRKRIARCVIGGLLGSFAGTFAFEVVNRSLVTSEPDPEASWLLSRCYLQEKDWEHAALALKGAGSYRHDYPLDSEPAPYVEAARCAL